MLTLFRGGGGLWMSPQDAEALGLRDNDWVEAYNQNGIVATRAVVTHRVPKGVCLLYHSKDRHLNTPDRAEGQPRRHGERHDLDHDEADPHDRRLRAALVRLQLLRSDGVQPRHARRRAQAGNAEVTF